MLANQQCGLTRVGPALDTGLERTPLGFVAGELVPLGPSGDPQVMPLGIKHSLRMRPAGLRQEQKDEERGDGLPYLALPADWRCLVTCVPFQSGH